MVLAIIHWNSDPELFNLWGISFRYYSLCWMIGIVLAYLVARRVFLKNKIGHEIIDSLAAYVIVGTLVGARLGHCLFYDWEYFSHHILEIFLPLSFSPSGVTFTGYAGLASHGGAIGIVAALLIFHFRHKIPLSFLFDSLALVAPLTGAFIRIGNFFNSEIIGSPTNSSFGIIFERVDSVPRHPAQLYEAIAYLLIFSILLLLVKQSKMQRAWRIFGLSLSLIFIARFIIEFCKEVQEPFEEGLRTAIGMDMGQLLSIPFIIIGIVFLFFPKNGQCKYRIQW